MRCEPLYSVCQRWRLKEESDADLLLYISRVGLFAIVLSYGYDKAS